MAGKSLRSAFLRTLSAQLGNPTGLLGGIVAKKLNQNNLGPITAAVDALGPLENRTLADIGFGGGIGLELLLGASQEAVVHGVEPSGSMIKRARREFRDDISTGRLSLHSATMESLPFTSGQLDGWISLNTVYFIDDLRGSLAELERVLAPGGLGVLGVADPVWLAAQPFAQQGFKVRSVAELTNEIESAGLVVDVQHLAHDGDENEYNLLICRRGD